MKKVMAWQQKHLGRRNVRKWFMPAPGVGNMISCMLYAEAGAQIDHKDTIHVFCYGKQTLE